MPSVEIPITLKVGDQLILTHEPFPGKGARYDRLGALVEHAHVSCTFPQIFSQVKKGEPVWFDDGKIGGIVSSFSVFDVFCISVAVNFGAKFLLISLDTNSVSI